MSVRSRYLIFQLGGDVYGTPILGVREVVEPQPIKPIPNAVDHFAGVMNVRGEIVGVVDLRLRLGLVKLDVPQQSIVIFDSAVGPVGAIVDKVEFVVDIPDSDIEKKPKIETKVPVDYLLGIGKYKDRLVSLIDFNRALGAEELSQLRSSKLQGL